MLKVSGLNFSYSSNQSTLSNINFDLKQGEILSILGESGSGKSTLLKLIYGLEDVDFGEIFYQKELVTGPRFNLIPGNLNMKFVPQEFDLLDSITAAENVGKYLSNFDLPLKFKNIIKALDIMQMAEFASTFPSKLSGGQRQRVAIARAISANPKMLLLDEPYSHLDQPLKFKIRKSIWNWAKKNNCTVILTTHDSNDALDFSDRIIILKDGMIVQNAHPEKLRNNPENEYVASLFGEFSILNSKEMKNLFQIEIPENRKAIVYPEEIVESDSGFEFNVVDISFRGRDYLVEVKNQNTVLKFYCELNNERKTIKLKLKNYRLVSSHFQIKTSS